MSPSLKASEEEYVEFFELPFLENNLPRFPEELDVTILYFLLIFTDVTNRNNLGFLRRDK